MERSAGACPPRSFSCLNQDLRDSRIFRISQRCILSSALAAGNAAWNVARGPVPRDRCHTENRPLPIGAGRFLSCPMRGEGQALALRAADGATMRGEGQALALRAAACTLHVYRKPDPPPFSSCKIL